MKAGILGALIFLTIGVLPSLAVKPSGGIPGEVHVYKKVEQRELKLYVVKPADWKAGDKRPAIVFYFGGGFVGGTPAQFAEQAKYLASRGMVSVLVEYRVLTGKTVSKGPALCVMDAKSAMRWVRGHAGELGVDPARIASAGGSAGGYLAAFVGMIEGVDDPQDDKQVSAKSNAMVLFNPVIDETFHSIRDGESGKGRPGQYLPIQNVSPDDPPAIIFFGTNDDLGKNVLKFKEAMAKAGVKCEVKLYEGQKHGFFNYKKGDNKYYGETLAEAGRFLTSLGWLAPNDIKKAQQEVPK